MMMLLLLQGFLLNWDNVLAIDNVPNNGENGKEWLVRVVMCNNDTFIIKSFDSKSSAESFAINDFVQLLDTDKKIIDLRKI